MKVVIEIPDDDCTVEELREEAVRTYVTALYNSNTNTSEYSAVGYAIKQLLKENKSYIIDTVINRIADNIEKERKIKGLRPNLIDIKSADKEVIQYFEEMINKAIQRKFK